MQITAAVVPSRGAPFAIEKLELASPRAGEVLVQIVATGMCHTDLLARDGHFPFVNYPLVCGHEGAGIIVEVGAAINDFFVGDRVVISFPSCGGCGPCRSGHPAYCLQARTLKSSGKRSDGTRTMYRGWIPVHACFFQQSSFATYAIAPVRNVVKARDDLPLDLLGPFGCELQTGAGAVLNVMQPKSGHSFAVFGVGAVGLAGLMAAKIAGCDPIIAVDVLPGRLALAKELGATHSLENRGADTLSEIRKVSGHGVHFSLETSEVPGVFRVAVDALREMGTCVLVGGASFGTEVRFAVPVIQEGRVIRGVVQGDSKPREFVPRLVDLFMAGQFPLDRLVTRYAFLDINRAAADATSGVTIKPVLTMPH